MNGSRQSNPSPPQEREGGRKQTPIRTQNQEYEQNPGRAWVLNRFNSIISNPEKRAEELEAIKNALFGYSMKVDCTEDTIAHLISHLSYGRSRPEFKKIWELRAAAALMLGGTRSKGAIPALISAFEGEGSLDVKEAICLALGAIGLEGSPLRRFSESLVMGMESSVWEGADKKSAYLGFIRKAFYDSQFQPTVVLGGEQEEFLTQSLAGRRPGSGGPLNWPARASAALLLGASCSLSTLPNLIAVAAKKDEVHQVREAAKQAAARMGRKDLWPTDVRKILNDFIAPGPRERSNPDMERAAIDILRIMGEEEEDLTPMPHMLSSAELELQSPRQRFIGMLRAARNSGDYSAIVAEFPVEIFVRNMASHEHVKISPENLPELKKMFSDLMRMAIRMKGPEAYRRAIHTLVDVAAANLLEARKELEGMGLGGPDGSFDSIKAERGLPPREVKFIESLRAAYNKGDYSDFVRNIKVGDAARMLISSSALRMQESHIPFLKQLTCDIVLAAVRSRGQKAFIEATDALYDMALDEEPSVSVLSLVVVNLIGVKKPGLTKKYNP